MPEYHMNTAGEVPVADFADGRYAPSTAPEDTHSFADLDAFTQAYIEAMFFTDSDQWAEDGFQNPEDFDFGDIAPQALASIMADCASFQALDSWKEARDSRLFTGDDSQGGHDFWLTRNGHGAGFWDRDYTVWPHRGQRLATDCKAFGTCDTYLGDDGKVYV